MHTVLQKSIHSELLDLMVWHRLIAYFLSQKMKILEVETLELQFHTCYALFRWKCTLSNACFHWFFSSHSKVLQLLMILYTLCMFIKSAYLNEVLVDPLHGDIFAGEQKGHKCNRISTSMCWTRRQPQGYGLDTFLEELQDAIDDELLVRVAIQNFREVIHPNDCAPKGHQTNVVVTRFY